MMRSAEILKRPLFGWLTGLSMISSAATYEIELSGRAVSPGGTVQVPILLNDASDVAVVQLQVNYDPQVLTCEGMTNYAETLGGAFVLDSEVSDGISRAILYRGDSLVSGSGQLAVLNFKVNPGAEIGMDSPVTFAEVGLCDQDGKDLAWEDPVSVFSSTVWVRPPGMVDSDNDGLPDEWENRYAGSADDLLANSDGDGDGLSNLQEYIAGLNPTNYDGFGISRHERIAGPNGHSVIHWDSVSGRVYNVYWSSNLTDGFTLLHSNIHWSAGCFTDQVHRSEKSGYYKIDVQLDE